MVLLDSAAVHMGADRLTKPKKRNALSDYLTVLAIDKENAEARQGVENIVERYVAMAGDATLFARKDEVETAWKYVDRIGDATGAGQLEKASGYLKQARFVLDAMKLRKWSRDRYDALFQAYREAGRVLAAAR